MRHSGHHKLSDQQVRRIEERRQKLELTRTALLYKFEEALKKEGCIHTNAAAKMRLDRVLNPRMRRPMSDDTRIALASALDWSVAQFNSAINIYPGIAHKSEPAPVNVSGKASKDIAQELSDLARRLQHVAETLQSSTHYL